MNSLREIQALRRLSPHAHVIKLLEVLYDQPTGRLALVFELMVGGGRAGPGAGAARICHSVGWWWRSRTRGGSQSLVEAAGARWHGTGITAPAPTHILTYTHTHTHPTILPP